MIAGETVKMQKIEMTVAALVLAFSLAAAETTVSTPIVANKPVTGWAAKAEQMAMAIMPQEKFNEAAGFFGPVSKKYLPVFQKFVTEYQAASEKLPVVAKYMPDAEAAYADAQAMKVPAKYEAQKTQYLKMIGGFMNVMRMTMRFSGQLATQSAVESKGNN